MIDFDPARVDAVTDAIDEITRCYRKHGTKPSSFRIAIAALTADTKWRAEQPPIKRVPGGPPCPTCGFRIVTKERVPFAFDDAGDWG